MLVFGDTMNGLDFGASRLADIYDPAADRIRPLQPRRFRASRGCLRYTFETVRHPVPLDEFDDHIVAGHPADSDLDVLDSVASA